MTIEKLKRHKSPATDQFPELIKAEGWTVCSEIHKLINTILNKEELPDKRKVSIIVPIYKKGDKTDCNIYNGFCQPCTKCFPASCNQGLLHIQRKLLGSSLWILKQQVTSSFIHSFSILSDDRSTASSKMTPPYSAMQSLLFQMRISSPVLKVIQ